MDPFPPITHVAVTVSDLERSVPWYLGLFDAEPVLDEDTGPFRHVVFAVGETLFGVAFGVAARGDLEKWAARLDELGVGHGDIVDAGYGSGLSFRDPDGIALELFAPPAGEG
jgi:glyoxylase I family protein